MLEIFNRFALLASSRSEVIGAAFVILILIMMVIPMQPAVLDVLLAINFCLAIVMVISAMLVETPLAFSSFPAILLVSTLFRLALTISTTRQILLEADAGHIVQTFGEFVVGGNVVVGLVIFLIISVVNFLVVTKGSERVAEVAARFSLDGMPGKQMSIDGDLKAGLITQAVAKQRRSNLEKESQLFGAMDGAIKFVKNDAIAGLVITLVNLIGGLAIGMLQKDMTFSQAGHVYTILSVGDGLVAILPSLMVSVAAGLIVTRVTKGEADGANTAQDMIRELSQNSKALQISALVCLLFAAVPGMPSLVFIAASGFLLMLWFKGTSAPLGTQLAAAEEAPVAMSDLISGSGKALTDVMQTRTFSAIEIRIPEALEPTSRNLLQNICRVARNNRINDLGVMLPVFEFVNHDQPLMEFYVYGVPSMLVDPSDKRLCIRAPWAQINELRAEMGIEQAQDPVTGRVLWLVDPSAKPQLEQKGVFHVGHEERILEQVETLLIRKMDQLFTLNEYQRHVAQLGEQYAEQLKELERVLPATKAVDIIQRLLMERVSIKNMRSVLNSLIEWGQRERDPQIITEQVRRGLHEQICHQYAEERTLKVFVCATDLEQVVREAIRSDGTGSYMDVDSTTLYEMNQILGAQIREHLGDRHLPAIVCSMDVRQFLRNMISETFHVLPVLSHQEVSASMKVQVVGNLDLSPIHLESAESIG